MAILAAWRNIGTLWKNRIATVTPRHDVAADCKSQIFHEELGKVSQRSLVFLFFSGGYHVKMATFDG